MKLSICIATYNRGSVIGETLECILPQLSDECELVIADGASPDNTQAVVESYQARSPHLRYVRLSEKGGVDQDYCKCVEAAQGEFCWLMTDDDVIVPDAVELILSKLRDGLDLVVVNASAHTEDFSQTLSERRLNVYEDRVFTKAEFADFAAVTGQLLSFIGAVVIRRSVFQSREKEPYFGTEFIHIGVMFQKVLEGDVYLISRPLIQIRIGVAQWMPRAFRIWMFKWPNLIWSFDTLPDWSKEAIVEREPWRKMTRLAVFKARGDFSLQQYADLPHGEMSAPRRFVTWALAAFPNRVYRFFLGWLAAWWLPKVLRVLRIRKQVRT